MIPLRDVIPSRTVPFVTVAIIVLNALAWFFELSLSEHDLNRFLFHYGVVPAYFSVPSLFTSMFLHYGLVHLAMNMWALWVLGRTLEAALGPVRFGVLYLVAGGIVAATHHYWNNVHAVKPIISALLATLLWPLLLVGVNLHMH